MVNLLDNKSIRRNVLLIGILGIFVANVFSQEGATAIVGQSSKTCTGEKFVLPTSIASNSDGIIKYLQLISASTEERSGLFRSLSNEDKSLIVRLQYAMQIAKRQNLSKEQSALLLEAINKVSADTFDKTDPEKIRISNVWAQELELKGLALFSRKEAFEIFGGLHINRSDEIRMLTAYMNLLVNGMMKRRQLIHEWPDSERIMIWKTQLAFHLAASSLKNEQRQFIVDMIPKIGPTFEVSRTLKNEEREAFARSLEKDIFSVFTKQEGYAIFMEIGIQQKVEDGLETANLYPRDCGCRWYCSSENESCGGSCRVVSYCGPFDDWDCTGYCRVL